MKLPKKFGQQRSRVRFAFFPVTLDNGERIWLEAYLVVERYTATLTGDGWAQTAAFAARLRTYAAETLPALERDALVNDRIRRDLLCPSCGASCGASMYYSHGKCMDCGRSCGCSFNPTSGADWCRAHKPQAAIDVPAILAARRAAATPTETPDK
jgi:hypothetical protein